MTYTAAAFAAIALAASTAAAPVAAEVAPKFERNAVVRLSCNKGTGSGVVIAPNTFITASHVLAGDTCEVSSSMGQQRFNVVYDDAPADFAMASTVGGYRSQMEVSCAPLVTGERYWLLGFPGGQRTLRTVEVRAAADYFDVGTETGVTQNLRAVDGRTLGGMSGGAVVDGQGKLVAFISAVPTADAGRTLVKEIRDLPFCAA